jgi:hypothetical protein
MTDVKRVYQLSPSLTPLLPPLHRGKLVYRANGSTKQISYNQLKKELVNSCGWLSR